jgi:hypothetical protein
MSDWTWVAKIAGDFGVVGVMIVGVVLLYRLADKWAALFLEAQKAQSAAMAEQAAAMAGLAGAVREGQSDQREVLMAVRLLADRMDQQREYLVQMDVNYRATRCA